MRVTARSQSPVWRSTAVRQARQSWAVGSRALAVQKLNLVVGLLGGA